MKIFLKRKNLVPRDYSKHTHTHNSPGTSDHRRQRFPWHRRRPAPCSSAWGDIRPGCCTGRPAHASWPHALWTGGRWRAACSAAGWWPGSSSGWRPCSCLSWTPRCRIPSSPHSSWGRGLLTGDGNLPKFIHLPASPWMPPSSSACLSLNAPKFICLPASPWIPLSSSACLPLPEYP